MSLPYEHDTDDEQRWPNAVTPPPVAEPAGERGSQPTQGDMPSGCNCRWDGYEQIQTCELHQAHIDAIHEWAERAKTAERKLAALATHPATNEPEQAGEREAFEAWYFDKYMRPPARDEDGFYTVFHARDAWEGWQARAAIQRTEQSAQQRSERMQAVRDFIRADADLARGITKKEG